MNDPSTKPCPMCCGTGSVPFPYAIIMKCTKCGHESTECRCVLQCVIQPPKPGESTDD